MIVTVTPAPSLDRTYTADSFQQGRVNRATSSVVEASGKGVNVSRALTGAGVAGVAVLPLGGAEGRQLADLLAAEEVPFLAVNTEVPTRTNTTLTVPGAPSTKMNAPAPDLPAQVWADLEDLVGDLLRQHPGAWVLCSGSVPAAAESVPARLVELTRRLGGHSAVDSSGPALGRALTARPDLIAPNHLELAELLGIDALRLNPDGNPADTAELLQLAAHWAAAAAGRTSGAVLATLGAAGALYADAGGVWHAAAPPIVPVNSVGAGDALLAGFLSVCSVSCADRAAHPADAGGALATAVAWGTAACALPGTSGNVAAGARIADVEVRRLRANDPATPGES